MEYRVARELAKSSRALANTDFVEVDGFEDLHVIARHDGHVSFELALDDWQVGVVAISLFESSCPRHLAAPLSYGSRDPGDS